MRRATPGVRRHRALCMDNLIQPRKRDAKSYGKRRLRNPERLQELLKQHFAGMSGRPMRGEPPPNKGRWRGCLSGDP
jgi:hypothetical protein